jgi:hypothetical protein
VALNLNFPNAPRETSEFAFSRIGTFQLYNLTFRSTPPYGLAFSLNDPNTATASQARDEAIVNATKVSVTAMQVSFDHSLVVQVWLQRHLRELFRCRISFQLLLAALCGWLHREQTDLIAFLHEENRVLKTRLGGQRLRFEDDERDGSANGTFGGLCESL